MALPFDQRCFAAPDAGGSTTPPPGRLPIISADERLADPDTLPRRAAGRHLHRPDPQPVRWRPGGQRREQQQRHAVLPAGAGRVYTGAQFTDRFENQGGLGGKDTIRERLGVLTTKGYVKFFRDHDAYGLPPATRSKFGYLCVEGMHLGPLEESVDPDTGEVVTTARWVLPTHYKCPQSGTVLPVENPDVWVYLDDGEAVG